MFHIKIPIKRLFYGDFYVIIFIEVLACGEIISILNFPFLIFKISINDICKNIQWNTVGEGRYFFQEITTFRFIFL